MITHNIFENMEDLYIKGWIPYLFENMKDSGKIEEMIDRQRICISCKRKIEFNCNEYEYRVKAINQKINYYGHHSLTEIEQAFFDEYICIDCFYKDFDKGE